MTVVVIAKRLPHPTVDGVLVAVWWLASGGTSRLLWQDELSWQDETK